MKKISKSKWFALKNISKFLILIIHKTIKITVIIKISIIILSLFIKIKIKLSNIKNIELKNIEDKVSWSFKFKLFFYSITFN